MLYELAQWLSVDVKIRAFNVFTYITLRVVLAALTALAISFIVGPMMIRKLTRYKIGQSVRDDGPQTHLIKTGTPTMGGALILVSVAITTLLWADLTNRYVWIVLLTTLGFGAVGWIDDWRKVVHRNPKGLSAKSKLFWQSLIAITAVTYLAYNAKLPQQTELIVPFFKTIASRSAPSASCPGLFRRRRHVEREPHRRPRRPGDHAHGDDRIRARGVRLRLGQRGVRQVPVVPAHPGRGRARSDLRGDLGGGARVPVVQRLSRRGVHGGRGRARPRRRARDDRAGGAQEIVLLSWAACSWSRRSSVIIQVAELHATGSACSAWRRCTTTTN